MPQPGQTSETSTSAPGVFATTHWSVVLAAGKDQSPQAQEALSRLCETYWYPLYAFVRRQGRNPHDAQDLTQEFFARLLRSHFFVAADPKRGRFRSFLLASLKHFLMHEWEKDRAQKRGGGRSLVRFDAQAGETRYGVEPVEPLTAEAIFERRWALTLLDRVLERLGADYAVSGRAALFDALKPALTGEKALAGYADLAARLGMSEGALKVAVHRLRQRYGELLREEIAHTVASPGEVEGELRHLLSALSG
jgi:RNA polymerase sigma factor (sigma-70 family)